MWLLLEHPKDERFFKPRLLRRGAHRLFDVYNSATTKSIAEIKFEDYVGKSVRVSGTVEGSIKCFKPLVKWAEKFGDTI